MNDEVMLILKLHDQIFGAARHTVDDFSFNVLNALRNSLAQIASADNQFAYSHVDQVRLDAAACSFDFG